jgi:hypothetical protein
MQEVVYLPLSENIFLLTNAITSYNRESANGLSTNYSSTLIGISADGDRTASIIFPEINPSKKDPVLPELFKYKSIYSFYMNFDYHSSDPFSLIAFEDNALFELSWNGDRPNLKNLLMSKIHIWKSEKERIIKSELKNESTTNPHEFFALDSTSISKIHEGIVTGFKKENIWFTTVIKDSKGMKMVYGKPEQ